MHNSPVHKFYICNTIFLTRFDPLWIIFKEKSHRANMDKTLND